MNPKLTAVTLGVKSMPASARFYEALGLQRKVRETGDEIACERLGLNKHKVPLSTEHFRSPKPRAEQLSLFA